MKNNIYFKTIPNGIMEEIFINSLYVWDMLMVKDRYLKKMDPKISSVIDKTVIIKNNVHIASDTIIEPYCIIEGPVYIGENCYIRPHCFIRAGTVIGDNVTIGHGVEVKNSIIMDECKLDSHSFVGDSIFGVGVRNGSGTITANRRFDQKDILISFNGDKIETNLDKFGCIIGEYSRLGANCTTAPGICIGQHTWVYPNTFINKSIKSNTLMKLRQKIESEGKRKRYFWLVMIKNNKSKENKIPNVVIIGGGTGTFVTLLGLKKYPVDITAIVTMMDSGGSNRVIRDEFGLLPTSGIRQCQVALADVTTENQKILRQLFEYRFDKGVGIAGMTFGNLFMAGLTDILGSQVDAIKKTNELLNVKGEIFPVSLNNTHLLATYEDGSKILGEHWIDEAVMSKHDGKLRIIKLESIPPAYISPQAENAIKKADAIIFSAGDLFTNTIANLIVKGVPDAIKKSKAKKIVVVNLMTKLGETYNYKATDFVTEIEKYVGNNCLDSILINSKNIPGEYKKLYIKEHAIPIENDFSVTDKRIKTLDLLSSHIIKPEKGDSLKRSFIRHDPLKLAKALYNEIINV